MIFHCKSAKEILNIINIIKIQQAGAHEAVNVGILYGTFSDQFTRLSKNSLVCSSKVKAGLTTETAVTTVNMSSCFVRCSGHNRFISKIFSY